MLPSFVDSEVGEMIALGLMEFGLFLVSLHFLAFGAVEHLDAVLVSSAISSDGRDEITFPPSPESIATTVST